MDASGGVAERGDEGLAACPEPIVSSGRETHTGRAGLDVHDMRRVLVPCRRPQSIVGYQPDRARRRAQIEQLGDPRTEQARCDHGRGLIA